MSTDPISEQNASVEPSQNEAAPDSIALPPSSGDILVVDDEVAITDLIAETLREEGYTVQTAHDGASALLDILSRPPALVILDIGMPVMTGDELLRYLRRNQFADLPVIILTAGMHPERMLDQGATVVLAKPFDLNVLLDCVTRHTPPPTWIK